MDVVTKGLDIPNDNEYFELSNKSKGIARFDGKPSIHICATDVSDTMVWIVITPESAKIVANNLLRLVEQRENENMKYDAENAERTPMDTQVLENLRHKRQGMTRELEDISRERWGCTLVEIDTEIKRWESVLAQE